MSLHGFQTLQQAQESAKALEENNRSSFNIALFKKLLSSVTQARENNGFHGRFLQRITPYPGTTVILWGPLKGAFPSLVRTLTYLKEHSIINATFTLQDPETYLVFDGDVINNSPYALETLTLVLALMNANPQKVIYLRGSIEDNLNWQNDSLKRELKKKLKANYAVRIPLERELTSFFSTLPLALYLTEPNPEDGALRISYQGRDNKEIQETGCKPLFTQKSFNVSQLCYLSTPLKGPDPVKAIIKAEQRLMTYDRHPGLLLVEPDRGAVAWNIFSGPSPYYQNEYSFYTDAFARVVFGTSLNDTTITLYNRDIRTTKPIKRIATYTLLTGVVIPEPKKHSPPLPTLATLQAKLRTTFQDISQLLSQTTRLRDALALEKETSTIKNSTGLEPATPSPESTLIKTPLVKTSQEKMIPAKNSGGRP
jgi:hypothetical protein